MRSGETHDSSILHQKNVGSKRGFKVQSHVYLPEDDTQSKEGTESWCYRVQHEDCSPGHNVATQIFGDWELQSDKLCW